MLNSAVIVIRILRDLCNRVPTWSPLSGWVRPPLVFICCVVAVVAVVAKSHTSPGALGRPLAASGAVGGKGHRHI